MVAITNAAIAEDIQFGFTFRRTDTELRLIQGIGSTEDLSDVTVYHFLGGALIEFQPGKRVRPFIDIGAGAVYYSPDNPALRSYTRLYTSRSRSRILNSLGFS